MQRSEEEPDGDADRLLGVVALQRPSRSVPSLRVGWTCDFPVTLFQDKCQTDETDEQSFPKIVPEKFLFGTWPKACSCPLPEPRATHRLSAVKEYAMKYCTTLTVFAALFATTLLGCSGTTEEPNKSGQRYINLNTGETTSFGDGETVPPDYAVCDGQGCPEPYPCAEIDPDSCGVRTDCVAGYSPGCNPDEQDCSSSLLDDDAVVCVNAGSSPCDPSECPQEINLIARICADGSVGTPICQRLPHGMCDYVHQCEDDCGPSDCGPIPEIAMICPDGSLAEPVCERTFAGTCGVGFQCDPKCSDAMCEMYCEFGFKKDANGCEICSCATEAQCPEVMCTMHCEHGFEKDAKGCEICVCKGN